MSCPVLQRENGKDLYLDPVFSSRGAKDPHGENPEGKRRPFKQAAKCSAVDGALFTVTVTRGSA